MSALALAWERILGWLAVHAVQPGEVAPPAAPEQVAALAAHLGRPLPADLLAFLSLADGARVKVWTREPSEAFRLFGCAEIAEEWRRLTDLHLALLAEFGEVGLDARAVGPVRAVAWSPAWIPVATSGAGARLCLDTEPAPGGAAGQVILYYASARLREVQYPSLTALLAEYADGLARGDYVDEPYVGIVPA